MQEEITVEKNGYSSWNERHEEKENLRNKIRNRVRRANVNNEYFIPALPAPTINDSGHKVVAVYARVSTSSTDQTSSIENQTQYYTKKIAENPDWELEQIYSDEGKSGTSMKHRDAFKQMMENAAKKKIDLILCASVSRFARNVADCMEKVRELKTMNPSHPVGVYFETENIYTLDPASEQAFAIHAILADWESANKSRRMILSYDQRICTGQYPVADLLGYRHTVDGDLIIQPEEAKTVRYVYLSYLCGNSLVNIANVLTEKQRPTLKGRTDWNPDMVWKLFTNERRWGDLEARKTIVIDYVNRTIVKNNRQRDSAYVPGHHEGIVSVEMARTAKLIHSFRNSTDAGIPELRVIHDGKLKGFVSIHPSWPGISGFAIESASEMAYSDEELQWLRDDMNLTAYPAHQNGCYKVPSLSMFLTNDRPMMTISRKKISWNNACFKQMDKPEKIEILFHPILKIILIRTTDTDNANGIQWKKNIGFHQSIRAEQYCEAIYENMQWSSNDKYRIRGITRTAGSQKYMFFLLDDPIVIVDGESTVADGSLGKTWYSYMRRQILTDSLSDMTEDDINAFGNPVDDPITGHLPTREEMLAEIDYILASF